MECSFIRTDTDAVVCRRPLCGRRVKTPYAAEPARVHARCRSLVPIGSGDVVALALMALRVDRQARRLWRWITRKPCGCDDRQARWNDALPLPRPVVGWLAFLVFWRREAQR